MAISKCSPKASCGMGGAFQRWLGPGYVILGSQIDPGVDSWRDTRIKRASARGHLENI